MRSAANADDHATTMDVIEEVVNQYQQDGQHFDFICCVYPTAPLMKAEHLKEGLPAVEKYLSQCGIPGSSFQLSDLARGSKGKMKK